jgi:hypothetical protein
MSTSPGCKRLGDRRIVTRTPGYILRVEPSELDRSRFERLVAEARSVEPERAPRLLREALALWRGAPLADLAYEPSHRRRSRGSRSCAWQHSSAASMPTLPAVATASWRRSSRRSHRTVGVQLGPAPWSLHRRRQRLQSAGTGRSPGRRDAISGPVEDFRASLVSEASV